MAEALKVGENAIGLILTRSMAEMSRFAVAKGANPITFLGLAGMGDLVATCTSKLSRNYQLGFNIGNNMSLDDAKKEVGQVAEGLRTLMVIKNESLKHNINMPLVESLYNIIYENLQPQDLISDLINNPHEVDVEFYILDMNTINKDEILKSSKWIRFLYMILYVLLVNFIVLPVAIALSFIQFSLFYLFRNQINQLRMLIST